TSFFLCPAARLSSRLSFFFQAEDGIRDRNVTGVQTCALPICYYRYFFSGESFGNGEWWSIASWLGRIGSESLPQLFGGNIFIVRSEERRVGKEGRCGRTGSE